MDKREELQDRFVNEWLESSRRCILKVAPRTGKTRCALKIAKKLGVKKILVVYPRKDIQVSWESEIELLNLGIVTTFSTYKSLHKISNDYELTICDEQHEAGPKGLEEVGKRKGNIIGLSGSITKGMENKILEATGMYICSEYSIEEGVRDGVICDYEINVHKIKLLKEEKKRFNSLYYRYNKAKGPYQNMLKLQIIGMLQSCKTKEEYTKQLIKKYEDERLLIFCGQTDMADRLGIPVYHSKSKEREIFEAFCKGEGKHLACVKLIQAGITILPINRGIINYTSGASMDSCQKICRFLGKELYAPDKKAIIEFLSIDEEFDQSRVRTALMFFDTNKINYI